MPKAKKQSSTSKVSKPATQPAARPTDGRHYVPEWKREEVPQEKEAAAREQKGLKRRERRRAHIEVTDVGNLGEDLPQLFGRLWKQFQAGDNKALLDLIVWSLSAGRMPSLEARTEFVACYDHWLRGDVRSLDATFGVQRRKGKHVALRVKRRQGGHVGKRPGREQYRHHIVARVYELHLDEGLPIDKALFAKVDEELGLGTGTAEEIFYERESCRWREAAAKIGRLRVTPRNKTEN